MRTHQHFFLRSFLFLLSFFLLETTKQTVEAAGGSSHSNKAFTLGIRDSFMIAHSFHNHPRFGPAGGLHGATYTCDVEFACDELHPELNWVIDIGQALDLLQRVLQKYNFKNLDEVFPDEKTLTTTEFMCRQIHNDFCALLKTECPEFIGDLCVKLWESHKAWASYTAPVLN